jgi:hypothetical protein
VGAAGGTIVAPARPVDRREIGAPRARFTLSAHPADNSGGWVDVAEGLAAGEKGLP